MNEFSFCCWVKKVRVQRKYLELSNKYHTYAGLLKRVGDQHFP